MHLLAGAVIAERYRLDKLLGEGGMAAVWSATDLTTGQSVAVKILLVQHLANPELRARFLQEARAASLIDHPGVVAIHDVVETSDGCLAMVMDRLRGETLRERIEREGELTLDETAAILLPVISAVGTAHAAGVVHRDLKPDNVFISARPFSIRVLDFGMARLTDSAPANRLTVTGAVLGTPYYMAPEQVLGKMDIDARADVWSIGVMLYECLWGVPPFSGKNAGRILQAILSAEVRPLCTLVPDVPVPVSDLISRMLRRNREARPRDLCEVFEVLRQHCSEDVPSFGPARISATPVSGAPVRSSSGSAAGRPRAPAGSGSPGAAPSRRRSHRRSARAARAASRGRSTVMMLLAVALLLLVVAGVLTLAVLRRAGGAGAASAAARSGAAAVSATIAAAVQPPAGTASGAAASSSAAAAAAPP